MTVAAPSYFARAWMDPDGVHVWIRHSCWDSIVAHQVTHMLPWPTWRAVDGITYPKMLEPSYSCGACELHQFVPIEDPPEDWLMSVNQAVLSLADDTVICVVKESE